VKIGSRGGGSEICPARRTESQLSTAKHERKAAAAEKPSPAA